MKCHICTVIVAFPLANSFIHETRHPYFYFCLLNCETENNTHSIKITKCMNQSDFFIQWRKHKKWVGYISTQSYENVHRMGIKCTYIMLLQD